MCAPRPRATSARRSGRRTGAPRTDRGLRSSATPPRRRKCSWHGRSPSYVEHLASRGRAIADIPMYANAWLGPQPGQDAPGQYPSGGPASRVLDIWRAAAPSLALLGPDIYVEDADARHGRLRHRHPALLRPGEPPQRRRARARRRHYGALGWSAYGLDAATPTARSPRRSVPLGARARDHGRPAPRQHQRCRASSPGSRSETRHIDGIDITARGALALLQADAAGCRCAHARLRADRPR